MTRWQRTIAFRRREQIEISEDYEIAKPVGEITLSFLTPCAVSIGNGEVWLGETNLPDGRLTGRARLSYDRERLSATMEVIPIDDARLKPIWGDRLTRLLLRAKNPALKDTWAWRVTRT